MPGRDPGNLIEAEIDRVGPDAVCNLGQAAEVVVDLGCRDDCRGVQGRLGATERGVRNAIELFALAELGRHQKDRGAKPGPDSGNSHGRNGKAGKSVTHRKSNRKPNSCQCPAYRARRPLPSSAGLKQGLWLRWTKLTG